ncbi:MAG: Lnb N-terminal periplasmic domain-containing protein [Desulfuromonadaceae bacterium]
MTRWLRGYWKPVFSLLALAGCLAGAVLFSQPPSNNRNWQPDVALLPWAEIQGSKVTIHNIRNCDYRSETDYTVHHYDKTFDLAKLKSLDLSLVYWGSPLIAHTMLSFGFEGNVFVCFSVETRKEVGEAYSSIKGFFRQYELTYVVADERDLIGLRTNYRGEQVYMYRLQESAGTVRKVFLDYLQKVNSLKEHPEWYNALTDNCTTSTDILAAPYNPAGRLDWRIIVNGFMDEMLYESKAIDTTLPFPELKKMSLINGRAQKNDKSPEFSQLIRAGLPGMDGQR